MPRSDEAPGIQGHARMAITLDIYTHEDREAQRQALTKLSDALGRDAGTEP